MVVTDSRAKAVIHKENLTEAGWLAGTCAGRRTQPSSPTLVSGQELIDEVIHADD
jgi:hypothetical protein